jgi:hypothetical protein
VSAKAMKMNKTISQLLYPNRRTFFERIAISLSSQPMIRLAPAPLPGGKRRLGSRNLRRAVPLEKLSTAQRTMKARLRTNEVDPKSRN